MNSLAIVEKGMEGLVSSLLVSSDTARLSGEARNGKDGDARSGMVRCKGGRRSRLSEADRKPKGPCSPLMSWRSQRGLFC